MCDEMFLENFALGWEGRQLASSDDQSLPFKYFKTSPKIIRLAVMLYVRFPLSLRNVEDLLHERGIDISHETVRFWWHRFGPMFASEIKKRRIEGQRTSIGNGISTRFS